MSETKKEEKKKLADEDAARRIKQLEDQTETLRKQVANQKQEEETREEELRVGAECPCSACCASCAADSSLLIPSLLP